MGEHRRIPGEKGAPKEKPKKTGKPPQHAKPKEKKNDPKHRKGRDV